MSDFDSGNSVNCVLLDINLYETEGKIIGPPYLKVKLSFQLPKFLFKLLNIESLQILPSNLNCLSSILMFQMGLKTGDLDCKGQIGLET